MCAGTLTLPQSWQDETRERAVQIERKGGGGSMLTCDQGSTARLRTSLQLWCTRPDVAPTAGIEPGRGQHVGGTLMDTPTVTA